MLWSITSISTYRRREGGIDPSNLSTSSVTQLMRSFVSFETPPPFAVGELWDDGHTPGLNFNQDGDTLSGVSVELQ